MCELLLSKIACNLLITTYVLSFRSAVRSGAVVSNLVGPLLIHEIFFRYFVHTVYRRLLA